VSRAVTIVVPARAGLVGNPSDMYGGAVLAVPVTAFAARVEARAAEAEHVAGDPDGRRLVDAALRRASQWCAAPCDLKWESDIPRSVGLGGSSAIVIAVLRAAAALGGAAPSTLEVATTALAVEADDLGIAAGLQDRAVQAAATPVLVDMQPTPAITQLAPATPIRIVIAWRADTAAPSGDYHATLNAARPADFDAAMRDLAALARAGAAAFAAGDVAALDDAVAASAAIRNRVAPLSAGHMELVSGMERLGLRPASTGSGGAVAAVIAGDVDLDALSAPYVVETYGQT
jgi:mevalonate kinase